MKKLFILIIIAISIISCGFNIVFACISENLYPNIFTAVSGWVSGIATIIIGIIAYRQSIFFNKQMEFKEKNIDVVVENIEIVSYGTVPINFMGRICVPKDSNKMGSSRFLINVYSFMDKPIFNMLVIDAKKDNKNLVKYDEIQPIQKDMYGKSFLCRNEKIYFNAVIPNLSNYDGTYKLVLQFENEYGDIFQKVVNIKLNSKFSGLIQSYNSEKSKLYKQNQGI